MPPRTTPPPLDTLLAAFAAAPDSSARTLAAMALARARLRDDRVLAALRSLLDEDPLGAAECLATLGDPRAIPDLVRAFDSGEVIARADCAICAAEILDRVACAIELLGGRLTEAQRARLDAIGEEARRLWIPFAGAFPPGPPASGPTGREPRPQRNAPCPCGSGKKYKRCCAIERDGTALH
jgi:HEAT repeat protein